MSASIKPIGGVAAPGSVGTHTHDRVQRSDRQQQEPSEEQVAVAVRQLNSLARVVGTKVSFSVDRTTNKTVVLVINAESGEVIRQIPPEEALRIAAQIKRAMGALFDQTV